MRTRARAYVALAAIAIAAAGGCRIDGGEGGDAPEPTAADLSLSVSPNPLRFLVVCPPGGPQCFGSLDATVTIAETAGVGGRIEFVDVTLRDVTAAAVMSTIRLGSDWLTQQAGTSRIEAGRQLAVRPIVEGYPFPAGQARPAMEVVLAVRFIDDRGNVIQESGRFPVQ